MRRALACLAAAGLACAALFAHSHAQTPEPAAAAIPSGEDIVVIGRKIRRVKLNYALWGAHMKRCDVMISSGDAEIDRFVCTVLNACIKDGFRDVVPAKACLAERIASVAYRPPRWDPAESEPADLAATVPRLPPSTPIAVPREAPAAEIVVIGGRPQVTPGLWQIKESATFNEKPSREFQLRPGKTYTVCIAPDEHDDALERLLAAATGLAEEGLCTRSTVKIKSGKVTGGKTCAAGMYSLSYDVHGKVGADTMDTAVSILGEGSNFKQRYRRRVTGSRIGNCPA